MRRASFPEISPRPGANRLLGYLPKSKRIVLVHFHSMLLFLCMVSSENQT